MPQERESTKEVRKELLAQMTAGTRGAVERKVIRFTNDDVPTFLRELDKFERKSKAVRINIA